MLGRAVEDGGLGGIEFDDTVIDTAAGQGGEDVFDGMEAGVADGNIGRAHQLIIDEFDTGLDFGFTVEVGASKSDTGVRWSGFEGEVHHLPGVQCFTVGGDLARDRSLLHGQNSGGSMDLAQWQRQALIGMSQWS